MRPSYTLSLAALCAGLAATSLAAQNVFTLDELVFSASLTDVTRDRTGVRAIKLNQTTINSNQPLQFSDQLARMPGIDVTQNGPIGTSTSLRIRGMSNHYTGVTINGIDVTDPSGTQTGFDFGILGSNSISSVEIIYGSQSSIVGSGSIAGSINIETTPIPRSEDDNGTYSVRLGSYDTSSASINFYEQYDTGFLAVGLNQTTTEGFSAVDENSGGSESDGYDSTQLTITSEYSTDNNSRVGLSLLYQNSNIEYDQDNPFRDTPDYNDHELRAGRAYFIAETDLINHEFEIQMADTERQYSYGRFEGERTKTYYQINTPINRDNDITIGVSTEDEGYKSTFGNAEYETRSIYGELLSQLNSNTDFSLSGRRDDHSAFGPHNSWRMAGVWRPNSNTSVRTAIASGYRAPSPYELFDQYSGNALLNPEISQTVEFGLEHNSQSGTYYVSIFETDVKNKIVYSNSSYSYVQSSGKSTSQGVELGLEYVMSGSITVGGSYTYLDARDGSNVRLALVPRHDLGLSLSYHISPNTDATLIANSISDRTDITPDVIGEDYTVVNGTLIHRLNNGSELFVEIQNIFNEEYQTTRGYGTSDRAFYIGVRGTF